MCILEVAFVLETPSENFGRIIKAGYKEGKIKYSDVVEYCKSRGWMRTYEELEIVVTGRLYVVWSVWSWEPKP